MTKKQLQKHEKAKRLLLDVINSMYETSVNFSKLQRKVSKFFKTRLYGLNTIYLKFRTNGTTIRLRQLDSDYIEFRDVKCFGIRFEFFCPTQKTILQKLINYNFI